MFGSKLISKAISLVCIKSNFNKDKNIIIHHGLMGNSKNFKSISKNASFSNYVNSYLVDCRNHGQSSHTNTHTIQNLADDLNQFITQNKLNKKGLYLLGHSMGGMAVMKLTQKYPKLQEYVERVIIVDMFCKSYKQDKSISKTGEMLASMLQIQLNQSTHLVYKQIENRALSKDIAGLMKTNIKIQGQKNHKWICNLATIVKQYQHINQFQLHKNQWRKPVQVIYGAKSNYVNQGQIKNYMQLYPQMNKEQNFHRVQNAGHWVHFQNTKVFLKIMEDIFKKDIQK